MLGRAAMAFISPKARLACANEALLAAADSQWAAAWKSKQHLVDQMSGYIHMQFHVRTTKGKQTATLFTW